MSIRVDLGHLRRLEIYVNSSQLGYDIDPKLQVVSKDARSDAKSTELRDESIRELAQRAVPN